MILSSWYCYSIVLNTHRIQMIQNNERRIGCPLPSVGEKEKQMKITIDLELTTDEVLANCQNFTEKEKVSEEVKPQVKDTHEAAGLNDINKVLKDLENDKEYLDNLTWAQTDIHRYMLRELLSNEIISQDEWSERLTIIGNAWRLRRRMDGLNDWIAKKYMIL